MAVVHYYDPRIGIGAPAPGAVVGGSFTVSGTASCDLFKDMPGEPRIFIRHADEAITAVRVRLGSGPFVTATPTGPSAGWTRWTCTINGVPGGAVTITALVFASGPSGDDGSAGGSLSVTVDVTPPSLTVGQPADVVLPAPPYLATITGTASDSPAGVARVEWQFGSGPWTTASGTTSWTARVALPALGLHTVSFRARDNAANLSATRTAQVRVGDITAPSLTITTPQAAETFTLANGQVTVSASGTASDTQTGVGRVEWAVDGQNAFTQATPRAANDWSTWTAQVPIVIAGNHRLTVRALDKASPANTTTAHREFVVAEPFEPQDPEAVFSPTAYLDDLLSYATRRVRTAANGALVTRQDLVDTFLQPYVALVAQGNRAVANQSTSQVRLCVEVLRRYLAKHGGSVPARDEVAYRQAAYTAVLQQLGVSFDEVRLARVADDATRAALAARLGIALSQFRPDRLDDLLLQPSALNEAALKTRFGLEETTVRPLMESLLPEPSLLIWQKEFLRGTWQQQDDAAQSDFDLPLPVIDPDLLGTRDLRQPNRGNAAYDLWKARADALIELTRNFDTLRRAEPTQQAGFDRIVGDTAGPVAGLLTMLQTREDGDSIDAELRSRRLTLAAFLHLMRVRRLAVAGSMLDAEWSDVYAILVEIRKCGLRTAWRAGERQSGLILGPEFFRLSGGAPGEVPALPRWRATPHARQVWRRTLESRIQQEETVTQAIQAAVSAAEEIALPILRHSCVAAIAGTRDPDVIADRLTRELGIDCKDSGHQRTTRAQQALATLQEVLMSLRTGRFRDVPPVLGTANPAANWVLALDPAKPFTEADFDEESRWMGGYATWSAAMRVFAYPETFLLPELRPPAAQTAAFRTLMGDLRDQPRLTARQARSRAAAYLTALTTELGGALPTSLMAGAFVITEQLTDTQLTTRKAFIASLFGAVTNPAQAPLYLQEIFYLVPMALALQLQRSGQFLPALDWIETFYVDHFAPADRKIYRGLVLEETLATQYQRNPDNWLRMGLNPHEIATVRASAHTRFTLTTLVRLYLDFADAEFTRDDSESISRARGLYGTALDLLALPEMQAPTGTNASPFPPTPVPEALRLRAELNLAKLRSGRNIAGLERQLTPLTQPALTLDRLTAAGARGSFRPTPYRYGVLVERARNLVSVAQQVEQAFLAALEKRDAEVYNLLKAGHDLQLAGAAVALQSLRVREAEQGIGLAERQLDRATVQRDTYQGWIDAGLNDWERDMLDDYAEIGRRRNLLADIDAALTVAQTLAAVESGGFLGTGLGAGLGGTLVVGGFAYARASTSKMLNNAETSAQINAATASFERRAQEWELQRQLSQSDIAIGEQQIAIAQAHTDTIRQEEAISRIQHEQAQATVDFLAHKFTNAELYAWMSGVLGGAYSYFLQQATAMAQLAQHQLGFERQEVPPVFIKADYWDTSGDKAEQPAGAPGPDRQGLTGSVRLLQDITRLDQFAFDTNRRKLQLAETFSLARLFPLEFQQFRASGRLPFTTSMALFDRGFPGHYLRLIKRVRMSIVALVPPVQGVRATLIASGISRVVSGGDVFQTVIVRRDPEAIAFTSATGATGVLDLEPETGMLLPFESMGVDTSWELQLPKAANPFDFGSIADVLFTVEYTALQDLSYRQQVIRQLADTSSAESAMSVRDQFPDQWYDLNNSGQSSTPMSVTLPLNSAAFPPNAVDPRIQHVMLAVVRAEGQAFEIANIRLMVTSQGETVAVGGTVPTTRDGIISTRRGNASAWTTLIGRSPAGAWELTFLDNEDLRTRFQNEQITDLVLVVTYRTESPAWPA
ncbi:Ig-like domain-containing protein [Actinoplanes sp. NPDC000266]